MVTDLPRGHSLIAMTAITNTTLVSVVTQSRILSGMAREDVVPGIFAKVHPVRRSPWVALLFGLAVGAVLLLIGTLLSLADPESDIVGRLATVTVVFVLFIYVAVIISALKLRGTDESPDTYRANTPLLYIGIAGNAILLAYVLIDDPGSLLWVAGLLALGFALSLRNTSSGNATGHRVSSATSSVRYAEGGSVALPAEDMAGIGRLAYIKDPDGNVLGLLQSETPSG